MPALSEHYQNRKPSAIRKAQILFNSRKDKNDICVINLAIGNISLPMHTAMIERMSSLSSSHSPFNKGIVKYTNSEGVRDCQKAFIKSINAELPELNQHNNLNCIITDGGSQAMELMLLGVCGPGKKNKILINDPAYTNYIEFANRLNIPTSVVTRTLNINERFDDISLEAIQKIIDIDSPAGILIIPGDNPTGQHISQELIDSLAKVCIDNDMWLISDEAYRNLYYDKNEFSSIWAIDENLYPGIVGKRISIESASKMWNACGLRIGALVTDNNSFFKGAVSEYTANLCANSIGQYIFSSISELSINEINDWFRVQRNYYYKQMISLRIELKKYLPNLIISKPESALYLVIDFKNMVSSKFDILHFIEYCALKGKFKIEEKFYTLLLAPMKGFYQSNDMGKTQARIAIVEPEKLIKKTPIVLTKLLEDYNKKIQL